MLRASACPPGVAAQFVILFDLPGREYAPHLKVRGEVRGAQASLQLRDPGGEASQFTRINLAFRKQRVEFALALHDPASEPHGLLLHPGKRGLRLCALRRRQLQLLAEVQHMTRAGIVIQLGGLRQSHAVTLQKLLDLFRRERFDLAPFLSRVTAPLRLLPGSRRRGCDAERERQE